MSDFWTKQVVDTTADTVVHIEQIAGPDGIADRCSATCYFRRNHEALKAYQCQLAEGHSGKHHVEVEIGVFEWIN